MKAKIYEYYNDINGTCFSDSFVRDFEGIGCFELEVEIPDELNPYITASDNIAITCEGHNYMLNEVLIEKNDKPFILLPSIRKSCKCMKVKVYRRNEKSTAMYL